MAVSSINSNVAAYYAQSNIGVNSTNISLSVSRLSSGNRIVRASDDVAGLSIGTSLRTNLSTLKVAKLNTSLGTSLLQVADGALAQVIEILQRQKSLATQAGSGSLTSTERSFLNQEFQALTSEVDRLVAQTNFNGVKLLEGSLSNAAALSVTDTAATAGTLQISFADNIVDGETIVINGVTITAETDTTVSDLEFTVGSTTTETVQNLAARLNQLSTDNSLISSGFTMADKLAISEARYEAVGNTLKIIARNGGALSNSFRVGTTGTATVNNEAALSGSYLGTSFNLFTDASSTSITSTAYVLSDTGGSAAADPFDVAENLTLTIGGVTRTLFTFTSGGGSGTSGAYTLQDLANGINANAATTGVKASVVYNGTSYNIRLSSESLNGVAILDGGDSFNSTTFKLTGSNIDLSGSHIDSAGTATDATKSIIAYDGFRLLSDSDLSSASVTTQAQTVTAAVGSTAAATPYAIGDTIRATVNGTEYVLHTFVANDGLDNIVSSINSKIAQTGIYAVVDDANGSNLNVRLYVSDPSGVAAASGIALSVGTNRDASAATTAGTVIANATSGASRSANAGLIGGADDGIGIGNTVLSAASTIGDNILTALSQTKAQSRILLTALPSAGNTLTVGSKVFYFTSTASSGAAANEILIGDTIADTLDNAVTVLNRYFLDGDAFGSEAFIANQINITRDGDAIEFEGKKLDNVLTSAGGSVTIATNVSGASVTSSTLSNAATTYGLKVNGISNKDFVGTLQGFTATFTGTNDQLNLSIKVGDYTYSANNVDITVASNTAIRFFSDTLTDGSSGGYFDVQLRANEILQVSDQAGANTVASRLDAAFSTLEFLQNRNISSYTGSGAIIANSAVIGSLVGTKVTAQLGSFDGVTLTDIDVTAPSGSNTDAKLSFTVGGVVFSTGSDIGSTLGANQTYKLLSEDDPNQFISFTTGNSTIDISSSENALAVADALGDAFGIRDGAAALSFQVGATTADTLSVSLDSVATSDIFSGKTLDILTQEAAQTASTTIEAAIKTVTSVRANVGALQSRFNFAAANIESSVQNQDAARGELLDTDIASESTSFAISQVKLQAGISTLAQANQQLQALLKLIG